MMPGRKTYEGKLHAADLDDDGSETNNSKQQQLNRFLSSKYYYIKGQGYVPVVECTTESNDYLR